MGARNSQRSVQRSAPSCAEPIASFDEGMKQKLCDAMVENFQDPCSAVTPPANRVNTMLQDLGSMLGFPPPTDAGSDLVHRVHSLEHSLATLAAYVEAYVNGGGHG